jgi:Ca2+/Na+ antiporter
MYAIYMILSAAAIIFFVKAGLLRGIDHVANAMNFSVKTRGQLTGYATSVPELVCLVSAGLAGVWNAGLWNIASSNIINTCLMLIAVIFYGQLKDLLSWRFFDELLFAGLAIAVPVVLMQWDVDRAWYLVPLLLLFFVVYQVMDRRLNEPPIKQEVAQQSVGNLSVGIILALAALIAISIAGIFLGNSTAAVVEQMGIQPAIAGWILGFVTSIPEMVTFFAVYSTARQASHLDAKADTQECLDNLAGSNMANVGIVYPIGLLAFLIASQWLGS